MTVLRAHVDPARQADLERTYQEAVTDLPPGISQTFLVRDTRSSSVFQIITVWRSRADLNAMKASGDTPKGVQMFQSVGAAPELSLFEVVAHGHL
jgi:heme-degrading monooxygenase HmoA